MPGDVTAEDIREMREQGDLGAYVRSLMQRPDRRRDSPQPSGEKREFPEAAPPKLRPDGKLVGAWPVGAHRFGCTEFGSPAATCSRTAAAGINN